MRLLLSTALTLAAVLVTPTFAAAAPANDAPGAASAIAGLRWTSTDDVVSVAVPPADWQTATVDAQDVAARCLGTAGFHSVWYSVRVAEASVLQVTVSSDDVAAFQPVVTVDDAAFNELACGLAGTAGRGGEATATAYLRAANGPTTYLVRVASAAESTDGGVPTVVVTLGGRDVTPPAVSVALPNDVPAPGTSRQYDASGSTDNGSGLDWNGSRWTFHDGPGRVRTVPGGAGGQPVRATYTWTRPGLHRVDFEIADLAGNHAAYRFFVFVHDFQAPQITGFGVKSVPFPGGRALTLMLRHAELVRVRVLVVQGTRRLYGRTMTFYGKGAETRRIRLTGAVARTPSLTLTGSASDATGNASALPTCVLDPVGGGGRCYPR